MGWFTGDTIITNTLAATETKIIAGSAVALVGAVIVYFAIRTLLAYSKKTMAETARREVQLNNVIGQR